MPGNPHNIWIVVPFSRPENLVRVIDNFNRQTYPDKKLVIVENGAATGTCKKHGFSPELLLESGPHQSLAKNEALAEIRRRGGGLWTCFDDDDWYGKHHIEELIQNIGKAEVVGRTYNFVRLQSGLFEFLNPRNQSVQAIAGPTTTAFAEDSLDFPIVEAGEDHEWCEAMIERGATIWACSEKHFVYHRDGQNHTWPAKDLIVRSTFGQAIYYKDSPNEIAEEDKRGGMRVQPPSNEEMIDYMTNPDFVAWPLVTSEVDPACSDHSETGPNPNTGQNPRPQ